MPSKLQMSLSTCNNLVEPMNKSPHSGCMLFTAYRGPLVGYVAYT